MMHLLRQERQAVSTTPLVAEPLPVEPLPVGVELPRHQEIALERPGLYWFAWLGVFQAGSLAVALLIAGRTSDYFSGARPIGLFFGWGVLRRAAFLYGPPQRTLLLSAVTAVAGLAAAYATDEFRLVRRPGRVAAAGIGLAGVVAGIPMIIMASVLILAIGIWVGLFALVSLVLMLWVPLLFLTSRFSK